MKNLLKQFYIIIAYFVISFTSNAQKISLSELHTLSSNKNWETSNKYLLSKGWDYYNSKAGDDDAYNIITWSYERDFSDDKKASGWFYIYTFDGLPNKVMYRFRTKQFYTNIKNQLAANGYKLNDEEILDQRVIAKYSNTNYVLELSYSREEADENDYLPNSFTVFEITVYKKGGVYDPNNGKKVLLDDDGNLQAEYIVKDGKISGEFKLFNEDGSLKMIDNYKEGITDGLSTSYYYNNTTKKIYGKFFGNLKNDVKIGKWQYNIMENDSERNLTYDNYIDGIKEGEFRHVSSDSLIYGSYENDLLHGKYIVFRDISTMLLGSNIKTDTTKLLKTSEGLFLNNKKTAHWKEYFLSGTLKEEGNYIDDLKTGSWKIYYDKYVDEQNKELPYSRKLHTEENYENGELDGSTLSYSFLNKISVPCKNSNDKDCFTEEFVPIKSIANFSNGLLEGPFEMKNGEDELIAKGQYFQGKRTGEWIHFNSSILSLSNDKTYEKGEYISDSKVGKWKRFDLDNKLVESYTYNDNMLNGEHILFANGQITERRVFNNDDLTNLAVLDSNENTRINYKITSISDTKLFCEKFEKLADGLFTTQFSVKKEATIAVNPATFAIDFETSNNTIKNKDGFYKKETLDKKIIEEGNYSNNTKIGTWTTYYYNQSVKTKYEYNGYGILQSEFYINLKNNEPFSGEFTFSDPENGITEERKIKEGNRNGTTRYIDNAGKTTKKETYKAGSLKE